MWRAHATCRPYLGSATAFRPSVRRRVRDEMVRSLTVKLTLASLCSSLISVVLVGLFARYQTGVAFDRYVQDRALGVALQRATAYYERHGAWAGIDTLLHEGAGRDPGNFLPPPRADRPPPGGPPAGRPPGPPPGGALPPGPPEAPPPFIVADQHGIVVSGGPGYRMGDSLPADLIARGTPIE